jgi:hypothetical protein
MDREQATELVAWRLAAEHAACCPELGADFWRAHAARSFAGQVAVVRLLAAEVGRAVLGVLPAPLRPALERLACWVRRWG